MACSRCNGSGKRQDIGYITITCECVSEKHKAAALDKRSKAYKEAISNIVDAEGVTKEEAVKIFDEEFNKIA